MVTNNPFRILVEKYDPMYKNYSANSQAIATNPILSRLRVRDVNIPYSSPKAMTMDLYMKRSHGQVFIGDEWKYGNSDTEYFTGSIKFKKYTSAIRVSEDMLDRMEQMAEFDGDSEIAKQVESEAIANNQTLSRELERMCVNPWDGATTDVNYDSGISNGLFVGSATNTMGKPNDLNATAGTAAPLTALKLSGAGQTQNNWYQIWNAVVTGTVRRDYYTKELLEVKKWSCLVDPYTYAIISSTYEILNSTTGEREKITLADKMRGVGIEIFVSSYVNTSYVGAAAGTAKMYFIGDIDTDFELLRKNPPQGTDTWTQWEKLPNATDNGLVYSFEKHKKLELCFLATSHPIYTAADTMSYFKKIFAVDVTPYATS